MRIHQDTVIPLTNPNPPDPILHAEFPREALWQRAVERRFKHMGWETQHFWDAMHARAGFPDLVCWDPRTGKTVWAELKSETGRVNAAQLRTLLELAIANEVYLWRPSDLEEIDAVLSGEREVAA